MLWTAVVSLGAKNPPMAAVGHILNVETSLASISTTTFSAPNTVTSATHRLPFEERTSMYERDKPLDGKALPS
jgi:hypothetical protein